MPTFSIRTTRSDCEVYCFTTGTIRFRKEHRVVTEDQAVAHAMWLVRHHSKKEAERFLDDWIEKNTKR